MRLKTPEGWTASPASVPVAFTREDEAVTTRFTLTPPAKIAAGQVRVSAEVTGERAAARRRVYSTGYQVIEYPHTQRRHKLIAAEATVKAIDVAVAPGLSVGYIMGVGDQVPAALQQLGVSLSLIDPDELAWGDLSKYHTIVTGVRAYERRADLRANNHRLVQYVENGGTVVVQYNKMEFNQAQYGPYPGAGEQRPHHRRERAGQGAVPAHPVFTSPNRIDDVSVAALGAGARSLLPRHQGREVRRPGRDGGSLRVQQGREARRPGRSAPRQGAVAVCRARAVAAAAGGDRRGLQVDG